MTARIVGDGSLTGTKVYTDDGADISRSVRRVSYDHEAQSNPLVTVELLCEPVEVAGEARWVGLEDVPADALRAELDRREASS